MTLLLSSAQIFYLEYFIHRYLRYGIYKRPLLYCKTSVLNRTRYQLKSDSSLLVSLSKLTDSPTLRARAQHIHWGTAVITASVIYRYVIPFLFILTSLIITYLPLDYSMKQPPPHTCTTDQHCKGSNDHHPNWAQHVPVRGHYISPSSTVHSPIASLTQWT